MGDVVVDGKHFKDGLTKTDELTVGITYHVHGWVQVYVLNRKVIPYKEEKCFVGEGKTINLAGISVEHKRSAERG